MHTLLLVDGPTTAWVPSISPIEPENSYDCGSNNEQILLKLFSLFT